LEYEIIHRPSIGKFLVRLEPGKYAFLSYRVESGRLYIDSAYTPEEYRGRGIATRLMLAAIEYARGKRLKIVPICSFAVRFFDKHPEYGDMLARED